MRWGPKRRGGGYSLGTVDFHINARRQKGKEDSFTPFDNLVFSSQFWGWKKWDGTILLLEGGCSADGLCQITNFSPKPWGNERARGTMSTKHPMAVRDLCHFLIKTTLRNECWRWQKQDTFLFPCLCPKLFAEQTVKKFHCLFGKTAVWLIEG